MGRRESPSVAMARTERKSTMTYRKRLALFTLAATFAVTPLVAQQGPERQQRPRRAPQIQAQRNPSPELALRLRERLQLTDDQVAQLQSRRQQLLERRNQQRQEIAELTSRFRAGDITREELRQQLTAQRERVRALGAERAGAEDVLTEAQREQLGTIRRGAARMQMRRQAFQRGRASALRDRQGARGIRGAQGIRGARGMRGQQAQRAQRPAMRRRTQRPPGSF